MASKHKAMMEWLERCPALPDTLLFDFLNERQGSITISPVATDKYVRRYQAGNGIKEYRFRLLVMLSVSDSTDDTNVLNMDMLEAVGEWMEAQQAAENFPDFGSECSGYRVDLPDSMLTMDMRYENGFAKYSLPAAVQYYDSTMNK